MFQYVGLVKLIFFSFQPNYTPEVPSRGQFNLLKNNKNMSLFNLISLFMFFTQLDNDSFRDPQEKYSLLYLNTFKNWLAFFHKCCNTFSIIGGLGRFNLIF